MTRMRVSGSSGVSLVYSRAVRNVHRADGVGLESVGISLSDEAEIPPSQKGGAALAFHSAAARGAASVVLTFSRALEAVSIVARRSSLFMAVSQLSVCMCLMLGLACIVLYCLQV